jgi:hypothetical protein
LRDRLRPPSARSTSVKDDWCAWLPIEKSRVFDAYVQLLEASYTMLSISLNEAMELRRAGRLALANQVVCVVPDLSARLTKPLAHLLRSLADHAKHYGTIPNAAPLDPENFQGVKAQRSARNSALLCLFVLSQRAQFLTKISTLQEMVEELAQESRNAVEELSDGMSFSSAALWESIDANHFDLNTCLREAIVLLKSFLLALPDDQLNIFETTVGTHVGDAFSQSLSRRKHLRHRRTAQIASE